MKRSFLIILSVVALFAACQSDKEKSSIPNELVSLTGKTMGTSLSVKYVDNAQREFSESIDSLLIEVNNSMSTYIPNSLISIFNNKDSTIRMEVDHHFFKVFSKSKEIYDATDGAFNPAVMPLVKYWGFATDKAPKKIDSSKVDSLLYISNFDLVDGVMLIDDKDTSYYIRKSDGRIQLDFSAIAKGYGVDAIGVFLEDQGINNYMVEIGGEVRCRGHYPGNEFWKIGIEDPLNSDIKNRKALKIIKLQDQAIATSGNYRNVRTIDGKKYAHTINPKTGYPEMNELLSASILTSDCMSADGFATASMVLGVEKSKQLFENNSLLEGFLIFSSEEKDEKWFFTPGFKQNIVTE